MSINWQRSAADTLKEFSKTSASIGSPWVGRALIYAENGHLNSSLVNAACLGLRLRYEYQSHWIYNIFSRIIDIVVSATVLVVLSPFFLIVGVIIKLDSPGPVFFRQDRIGLCLRVFSICKFRTMRKNADFEKKASIPLRKVTNEHILTRLGKILRNSKIDELPQFFNVLIGDMTLVGPRPLPIEESLCVIPEYVNRYGAKPGLTGLWQATMSTFSPGSEKMRLDSEYVKKRSFLFDIKLILLTLPLLLIGEKRAFFRHKIAKKNE